MNPRWRSSSRRRSKKPCRSCRSRLRSAPQILRGRYSRCAGRTIDRACRPCSRASRPPSSSARPTNLCETQRSAIHFGSEEGVDMDVSNRKSRTLAQPQCRRPCGQSVPVGFRSRGGDVDPPFVPRGDRGPRHGARTDRGRRRRAVEFHEAVRRMAGRPGRTPQAMGGRWLPSYGRDDWALRTVRMVAVDPSGAAVGWAGRGLRSPLHDALLTDSIPAAARGRAFRFDEAADTAGAIAGPLAAMAIVGLAPDGLHGLQNYNIIFWLAAIPGSWRRLDRRAGHRKRRPSVRETSFLGSLRLLPRPTGAIWPASSSTAVATSPTRC